MTTTTLDALAAIPDGATTTITGRITAVEPRTTGQGNPWAEITVSGDGWEAAVQVLPIDYPQYQQLIDDRATVTVTGPVSHWNAPVMYATAMSAADGSAA